MPEDDVIEQQSTEEIIFAEDPDEKEEPLKLPDEITDEKIDEEDKETEPEIKLEEEEFNIVTPVNRKEILAAFPDLYKKFPFIETALSQHKQLTEILPTVEDAQDAMEKAGAYDNLYTEVMEGKTESILQAVKEEDNEAFLRIVDDYLPTLARVDERAFHHVVGNLFKDAVDRMTREGHQIQNEQLKNAAVILHQWVFGDTNWKAPTALAKPRGEVDQVKQKEAEFFNQRFESSLGDLNTKVSNVLKATIDINIDPSKAMTPFVKKHAVNEALAHVEKLISEDKGYRAINDRLWQNAFKSNFSQDSLNKIRSNYLARAKSLLRPVLAKARTDALQGQKLGNDNSEGKDRKGRLPVGRSAGQQNSGGKSTSKNSSGGMKPGESTYDFLVRD